MRFCLVTTFYPPHHFGGDAVFVHSLANALHRRGHYVEVIACSDSYRLKGGDCAASADNDGIRVHRLRSGLGPLSPLLTQQTGHPVLQRRSLRRLLEAGRFDVVNFHNISLIGGPGILSLSPAPVNLYTVHEHWLFCPTHILWKNGSEPCTARTCFTCALRSGIPPQLWRYTSLIERALRSVDLLLSPSEYTAARHREAGIAVPTRVLPTFTTLPRVGEEVDAATRPRFVYLGRVTASKGIEGLAEEFAKLPQYELVIAGDGDLLPTIRDRYASVRSIRFIGAVGRERVRGLLETAAALVLPAVGPEVFPLCILEAFDAGIPVITSAAGGAPEAVERSGGGMVYRSRDELLNAIHALAGDPHMRASMGARGAASVRDYYNEDRYVREFVAIAEEVLTQKRTLAAVGSNS